MNYLSHTLIALFSFLPILISAQTQVATSNADGLAITRMETVNGTVTVNLPNDMRPGDTISGTIVAESPAMNEAEPSKKDLKKREKLLQHTLLLAGQSIVLAEGAFSFIVPDNDDSQNMQLALMDESDNPIANSPIQINEDLVSSRPPNTFEIPEYVRSGYPQPLNGSFDGGLDNSSAMLNGEELEVLAESPRTMVIAIPEGIEGYQEIDVVEGDLELAMNFNVVDTELSVAQLNLMQGESTVLNVLVSGLEDLQEPVVAHLTNLTPQNADLQGGNFQELVIEPEMVDETGMFQRDYEVIGLQQGSFSIGIELVTPPLSYSETIPVLDDVGSVESGDPVDGKEDTAEEEKKCTYKKKTPWKENKKLRKKTVFKNKASKRTSRSRCNKCKEYVNWKYYTVSYFIDKTYERMVTDCQQTRGHEGDHDKPKLVQNKKRKYYLNRKVRRDGTHSYIRKNDKWVTFKE